MFWKKNTEILSIKRSSFIIISDSDYNKTLTIIGQDNNSKIYFRITIKNNYDEFDEDSFLSISLPEEINNIYEKESDF